jgi:Mg-chelatase subunit ChlD
MTSTPQAFQFVTRDFFGNPVDYYVVEDHLPPAPVPQRQMSHHVVVVDVSGSMYGEISNTRSIIEKVMTVEEFANADQHVSLISYSSKGDVTVHFDHVPVKKVLATGSSYVEQIRSLRAKALTCASQAFELALSLVRKDETTAITLHTDGFFNDPTPLSEQRTFDALIERARPVRNLFVNAVAYGYADFPLLSKIANAVSGKAVRASSTKEVFEALHDTSALIAGRTVPAILVAREDSDYLTSVNVSQKKINGTTSDLSIRGSVPGDDLHLYRYRKVSSDTFKKNKYDQLEVAPVNAMLAFARGKLAEGKINEAKFGLIATRYKDLVELHSRAITGEQLSEMAVDIELAMFGSLAYSLSESYGLANAGLPSAIAIFDLLGAHKGQFTVDLASMLASYKKRSLKRIAGTWSHESFEEPTQEQIDKGTFVPFPYKAVPTDDPSMVDVNSFDINNASPNLNMLVERPAKLVTAADDAEVKIVSGVKLQGKLRTYNNYTLIANGDLNVSSLPIRISDKRLFESIALLGVPGFDNGKFDANRVYEVPLSSLPVVPYDQSFSIPAFVPKTLLELRAVLSIFDAILKAKKFYASGTDSLSPEQVQELASYGLSPKLYFQPPTRNPYKDLASAIAGGLVDSRPKVTISIGTPAIPDAKTLHSANAFLARRFEVKASGKKLEKPKFEMIVGVEGTIMPKAKGRMTYGPSDDFLYPIFSSLFSLETRDTFDGIFGDSSVRPTIDALRAGLLGTDKKSTIEAAEILKKKAEERREDLLSKHIRPLAFYIGSSGLVPDGLEDAVAMSPDGLKQKFSLESVDEDANYLVIGNTVVSISVDSQYYSTPLGVSVAKELSKVDDVSDDIGDPS